MDLEELSARLDALDYPARQRVLADTARSLAGSPALTALLAELDAQPGVARMWAITMAIVAGDQTYVRGCLTSPDMAVAGVALNHCVRRGLHLDVIAEALPTAPMAWRTAFYRALRGSKSLAWGDSVLSSVRERFGDHEAAAVLPACDTETVAALLPELDFAVPNMEALALRHPTVVLDHLRRRLTEAGETERADVWTRYGAAVRSLLRHDVGQVLELLEQRGPVTGLPPGAGRWLVMLAKAEPERAAAILGDPGRRIRFDPSRGLCQALRQASDTALAALVRAAIGDVRLTTLLRRFPPSQRAELLDGALGGRDIVAAGLPVSVLDLLPWPARHAHARRLLTTRRVADDPQLLLEVTARLPWAEAEPVLRARTARPVAAEREHAYPLLIGAAAATRDPATVGRALASLTRLPNEQDPVRRTAMQAIAAIPLWLLAASDLPQLEKIATDALDARDTSWITRRAVESVAMGLVRHGAVTTDSAVVDCGLRILELAGGHNRTLNLRDLNRNLPRGAEHAVFEVLRPRIAADARVDRHDLALALAQGLHRRAWAMPDLQDYLAAAVTAAADHTVRQAIDLWLAPPATRSERVEAVFDRDPSTITVHSVSNAISGRRTDLLDRVLGRPLHGRFVNRGVQLVPIFPGSLRNWLPRQTALYATLLADLATAPGKSVWERTAAVRRLGSLPGVGADAVRPFLADGEVAVVETALAALAWTDRPDRVLGELLGYADTDRARVAVYAATRCARSVAPAALLAALRPVLAGRKVTSRKEAVRLVAEHRVPGAVDELTALWADPDLHRDVRRGIVSAARWLLDDSRMWTVLADAATAEPAVAAALTDARTFTVAEPYRARYGVLVRTVAGHPDPDTARAGLTAWPAWAAWDRDGAASLVTVSCDLDSTATWRVAVDGLITISALTGDAAPLRAVATTLAGVDDVAGPDRDLPAHQRLRYVAESLVSRVGMSGEALRLVTQALSEVLVGFADHRADGLALAVAALPRRGDLLPALRGIAAVADRPVLAWRVTDRLAGWLAAHGTERPSLLDTARDLSPTAAGALLAVGIADKAGPRAGWSAPWRDLVLALRENADPDVRERALRIVMASE
ncbi:hypothetical protein [Kutzneria buriramensis]|uniref:Uncharacterized protein n=1 Tax=Kutzneria buriramensis TaxID=1045776 RepID=A0A3E0H7K7_9PSEU|nr:hypothetical protein [Kutzneria buriramensis]REH39298.1 hypothetical protein BCF44_113153 [Kutzneria buriramensis]